MDKNLIVVGGEGSGEIALSVFEDINEKEKEWNIVGLINDIVNPGEYMGRYKVVGNTDSITDFVRKGYYIHYTYYFNVKKKKERVNNFLQLDIPIEAHATGIHPLAYVNPTSKIGRGCLLLPFSATSAYSVVHDFVHIYTGGFVGHNTEVNEYCTLAAKCVLGARINVGKGSHVGLSSSVREDVKIGNYSIIGMGSNLLADVGDCEIFAGNPARKIGTL